MTMELTIRSAIPSPSHPEGSTGICQTLSYIKVRHPGYDSKNVLFSLLAPDSSTRALSSHFVLTAAAIVAGNRFDGYLSTSRTPGANDDKITLVKPQTLLHESDYYFHVVNGSDSSSNIPPNPYPITPTFRHWRYPHNSEPESWAKALPPSSGRPNDTGIVSSLTSASTSCRITHCTAGIQKAHIIPKQESDWFRDNEMHSYAINDTHSTQDLRNIIRLRKDIHHLFDQHVWTIFPKTARGQVSQNDPSSDANQMVAHILVYNEELLRNYQNVAMQSLNGYPYQYFFAHFAWNIFNHHLNLFFTQGKKRFVMLTADDGNPKMEWKTPIECLDLVKAPNPSTSRKRKESSQRSAEDRFETPPMEGLRESSSDAESSEDSSYDSGVYVVDDLRDKLAREGQYRGRPRKRPWSPWSSQNCT